MQWDEKELNTQFTPNVYFWTSNSEILAKALAFGTTCRLVCTYYYFELTQRHTTVTLILKTTEVNLQRMLIGHLEC